MNGAGNMGGGIMAGTDTGTTVKAARRRGSRSLLTFVIEIFSVVSAASFFLSAAINTVVFRMWGVNFLSVASPSDVVMSGINLAVQASLAIGVGWLFWASQASADRWNRIAGRVGVVLLVLAYLVRRSISHAHATGFRGAEWIEAFLAPARIIALNDHWYPSQMWLMIALAALIGMLIANYRLIHLRVQIVFIAVLMLLSFHLIDSWLTVMRWGGYLADPIAYKPETFGRNMILWSGDRALIARKQGGPVFIVHSPESFAADLGGDGLATVKNGDAYVARQKLEEISAALKARKAHRDKVLEICTRNAARMQVDCAEIMRAFDAAEQQAR